MGKVKHWRLSPSVNWTGNPWEKVALMALEPELGEEVIREVGWLSLHADASAVRSAGEPSFSP